MRYIFADEAGCMEFARKPQASRYFVICTVHVDDCSIGTDLLELRRELAWEGLNLDAEHFHACNDPEPVRDRVYALLQSKRLRIDATLLEKSKVKPPASDDRFAFYKHAWYVHFKHCGPQIARDAEDLLIQAASIGTRKERRMFREAINEVAQETLQDVKWQTTFWSASSDPCLQVADYCAWAIQRAYERGDRRRLRQIEHHMASCRDFYEDNDAHYY